MQMIHHRANTQNADRVFRLYRKENRQENDKIPSGMEQDNIVNRFLIHMMNMAGGESSFFHSSFFFETMKSIRRKDPVVDNLCCFRGKKYLFLTISWKRQWRKNGVLLIL